MTYYEEKYKEFMRNPLKYVNQATGPNNPYGCFLDSLLGEQTPTVEQHVQQLRDKGCDYVEADFPGYDNWRKMEIIRARDKREISVTDIKFLIKNWVKSEDDLYGFLLDWKDSKREERAPIVAELFREVRHGLMDPKRLNMLKSHWKDTNIIGVPWKQLIVKGIVYHKQPVNLRVLDQTEQTTIRNSPTFVTFHEDTPALVFQPIRKAFLVTNLQVPKGRIAFYWHVVINNFLIMPMLSDELRWNNVEWYIMDPRTFEWFKMPGVLEGFGKFHHLVEDGKHVYVVGAINMRNEDMTDEIARFDFERNQWRVIAKLPMRIREFGTVILNGKLYVSGGLPEWFCPQGVDVKKSSKVALRSLYCMDLKTRQWDMMASMPTVRFDHKMDKLTIDGTEGLAIPMLDMSCEYYNPVSNQWCVLDFSFKRPLPRLELISLQQARFINNEVYLTEGHYYKPGWRCLLKVIIPKHGRQADLVIMSAGKAKRPMLPLEPDKEMPMAPRVVLSVPSQY